MELVAELTSGGVIYFLLLFVRFSAIFAFFPFFDNNLMITSAKAALAFYMTVLFFPIVPKPEVQMGIAELIIAVLSEAMLGFIASIFLQIVFAILSFAGEVISFVMGFSMASAFDPMTNTQKPIISQLLSMLALMVMLANDMHHLILQYVDRTLVEIPLGGFVYTPNVTQFIIEASTGMFSIGFSMAFPIIALILFSDIIFGMIMKSNPQFNLLVIGFPIKILLAFLVLVTVVPSIMYVFKNEFKNAFDMLQLMFMKP